MRNLKNVNITYLVVHKGKNRHERRTLKAQGADWTVTVATNMPYVRRQKKAVSR